MSKTVDVEYVGDPELLDETTRLRIAMGELPKSSVDILRGAAAQRNVALKGVTKRIVDPEFFGTSRRYVFGPDQFVVAVDEKDVDKILGSSSGFQFRLAGQITNALIRPPSHLVKVSEVHGSLYDIYR